MILFFVFAWLAYKRASENGRSGIAWAAITAAAFIGTQLIAGLGIGIILALGQEFGYLAGDPIEKYSILINIFCVVLSIGVSLLILRYLNKVPEDNSFTPPPAPPTF